MVERLGQTFNSGEWWILFDIFEFVFETPGTFGIPSGVLSRLVNESLVGSAYLLVDWKFIERMADEQMDAVQSALHIPFSSARTHFERAFGAWRQRPQADPTEVVRESIHAVEATCKELCKDPNADLNKALTALHKKRPIHPVLKQAIEKLYAWTGDEDGIRHSLKGKTITKAEKAEAQFALVTCSALANYLIARAEE
jgi:hypothetical protein